MYKKTISYEDYNGEQQTRTFYFNLSKAELIEMQFSSEGGLQERLTRMIETKDGSGMMKTIKELILRSYGEKSADGNRFIKSKELSESFEQSEAYSELFMEIATDEKAAEAFVNGIIPKQLAAELQKQSNKQVLEAVPIN